MNKKLRLKSRDNEKIDRKKKAVLYDGVKVTANKRDH